MASKQTEELNKLYLEWVAALKANPEMPLDEVRHMFEQWERITGEPGGVDYIETDARGVPALWAAPKNCAQDRVLLCAHGGGYVAGSMYTHRKVYAHVAKAIGCRALGCNVLLNAVLDRAAASSTGEDRAGAHS
jgi:monoterpene epsilon-lactone hydrolase